MSFNHDPMSRVPFFLFQEREHGIDNDASAKLGYEVPRLVTFILVAPHGHKGDPMEFQADEWLERKYAEAKKGTYDMDWVKEFRKGLELFREGKEIPREGTPLVTWERLPKRRREEMARRFPTVEDLAAVPDSSIGDIGLDGRVLRDLAKGDIQAKKDLSPVVKELAEAKEENRRLSEQMVALNERFDALERENATKQPARRGAAT